MENVLDKTHHPYAEAMVLQKKLRFRVDLDEMWKRDPVPRNGNHEPEQIIVFKAK